MKRITLLLAALAGTAALSGCVGYVPVPANVGISATYSDGYGGGYYGQPAPRGYRDRDGDGVPNRADRRPNNPYRY